MTVHEVKSWPRLFRSIVAGVRVHELRINDRGYEVGDVLLLREYDETRQEYTGSRVTVEVTSMTSRQIPCAASGVALADDHCILSIRITERAA